MAVTQDDVLTRVPFAVPLAFVVAVTDLIPMIRRDAWRGDLRAGGLLATRLWPIAVLVARVLRGLPAARELPDCAADQAPALQLGPAAVLLAGPIGGTALGWSAR